MYLQCSSQVLEFSAVGNSRAESDHPIAKSPGFGWDRASLKSTPDSATGLYDSHRKSTRPFEMDAVGDGKLHAESGAGILHAGCSENEYRRDVFDRPEKLSKGLQCLRNVRAVD